MLLVISEQGNNKNIYKTFSHVNANSNQPSMVDVSDKSITMTSAHAQSIVKLPSEVVNLFKGEDISTPKGPVFSTAIVAGTMAAKQTSSLIPFCHPLSIEQCNITVKLVGDCAVIDCIVSIHHKTGVEMEALTGASVAALTIYDMCKSVSHNIVIKDTRLIEKTGGKSDVRIVDHINTDN